MKDYKGTIFKYDGSMWMVLGKCDIFDGFYRCITPKDNTIRNFSHLLFDKGGIPVR
jgi:hypothetical protein